MSYLRTYSPRIDGTKVEMVEDPSGDYVREEDHDDAIYDLRMELEQEAGEQDDPHWQVISALELVRAELYRLSQQSSGIAGFLSNGELLEWDNLWFQQFPLLGNLLSNHEVKAPSDVV